MKLYVLTALIMFLLYVAITAYRFTHLDKEKTTAMAYGMYVFKEYKEVYISIALVLIAIEYLILG